MILWTCTLSFYKFIYMDQVECLGFYAETFADVSEIGEMYMTGCFFFSFLYWRVQDLELLTRLSVKSESLKVERTLSKNNVTNKSHREYQELDHDKVNL